MSRCFPFPPPNYRKEEKILTESIKLQKEQEASSSKERRKEKRRDKKEKRERSKDKKENSKDSKRAHKKRKHNEANELHTKDACQIAAAKKIELHTKGVAAEPLEKSGLTEEHGPPCLKPEPCVSSESTQTSSKGTIIRFKLPLQKHRDPKPTEPSTSKYSEPVPTKVDEPCFSGRVAETPIEMELGESSKSHKRRRDKEGKYRDLIINWKPTPLFVGDDSVEEDLGWLLDGPRRNRTSSDAKSRNNGCEELSYGSAAWSVQPKACYLPELDMYQLPYVTPF